MNDTERTSWLRCNRCASWYLAPWFKPRARCGDIAHSGELNPDAPYDGVLLEVAEWKRLHWVTEGLAYAS